MQAPSAPAGRPPQAGLQSRGILKMLAARKVLSMAVSELEPGSEPYQWCIDAIRSLKKLPSASEGLTETEGKAVQGAQAPVGAPPGGGPPGGAPAPAPPGGGMSGPVPQMMGPG